MVTRGGISLFLFLTQLSLWCHASSVSTSCHPAEVYWSSYDHLIEVNCSQSSDSCVGSLSRALGQAQKYSRSVLIQLSIGTFVLDSTVNTTFEGFDNLAIIGAGKSDSIVQCNRTKYVGFTFRNSSRVTLANVSFQNCGALQNSTSKNYSVDVDTPNSDVRTVSFMTFYCSLYFLFCSNITMNSVSVKSSKGSGLVLYNSDGTNTFTTSEFSDNNVNHELGGSGVTIDFSFCIPGDITCESSSFSKVKVSGSNYTFNDCKFSFNYAASLHLPRRTSYPHGSDYMAFGKGGGVFLHLGGQAVGNSIRFNRCQFMSNRAENGGIGFYIGLGDISINNTISVDDTQFSLNIAHCDKSRNNWTLAGGGVKIVFMHYPPDNDLWPGYSSSVTGNGIDFINTNFTNNIACYGGAVSFVSSREPESTTNSNSLSFSSCEFYGNQAEIASAVDLSLHYPDLVGQYGGLIQPSFVNCNFIENMVKFEEIKRYPMGMGAVYANGIPVTFSGSTKFLRNTGTALVILSTYVTSGESSVMEFQENESILGGAIAFIGNAWLIVNKNSSHYFTGNHVDASGSGGAIYAVHFGEHDLPLQQNCFFQYHKSTLPPSKWNSTFTFSNNSKDGQMNSIYSASMLPCIWLDETFPSGIPRVQDAFCGGHPWYFNGDDCRNEINTGPSFLMMPQDFHLEAVPGWPTKVGIVAYDDYHKEIETVLIAYSGDESKIGVNRSTEYVSGDSVTLYGVENQRSNLFLRTLDPRIIVSQVSIDVLSCPPGFVSIPCNLSEIATLGMTCDCVCPELSDGMNCNSLHRTITLYKHFCLTYQYGTNATAPNKSLPLVIGKCPYNIHSHLDLPRNSDDLDDLVCGKFNRTGVLCSVCREGFGVAVNHRYECVVCNPATDWLLFLAVKILPVTLLFIVVALLNVKITSSAMNAFVFYSQVISISYFYNAHPFFFGVKILGKETGDQLISLVSFPYGILNLDFFRDIVNPFCIGIDIPTQRVIAINYVMTIYPMLLIGLCYLCIKLYDHNFKLIRKLWHPFKLCLSKLNKNKKPTTSIIDAFATFLLLSYTNILYVSFPLLQPVTIYDASDLKHLPIFTHSKFYYDATKDLWGPRTIFLLFAIVIVVLFVIVPPLFLMLYPLKCFQSCISRLPRNIALKTFAESFTESFRNGTESQGGRDCRYFAGLYFVFRIAIFAVFVSELDWLEQYFIQQILFILAILLFAVVRPYKVNFYNYLDIGIFSLLALLNVCSMYNSQLVLSGKDLSKPVFAVNYTLLFVPLVYLLGYVIHYCVFSLRCLASRSKKLSMPSETIVVVTADSSSHNERDTGHTYDYTDSHDSQDQFADRILNPQNYSGNRYENKATPKIVFTEATVERSQKVGTHSQLEASTENSYLAKKRNQELRAYGSIERSSRSRHTEPIRGAR